MKKYLPLLLGVALILIGGIFIIQSSQGNNMTPSHSNQQNQQNVKNPYLTLSTDKNQLKYKVDYKDNFMIYYSYVDKKSKEEIKGYFYDLPDELIIQRKVEKDQYIVQVENQTFAFDPIVYTEDFKNMLASFTTIYSIEDDDHQLVIYTIRRDHDLHHNEPIITKINPDTIIDVELTDYIFDSSYGQYLFFNHYPNFDEIYNGVMKVSDMMVYDLENQSASIIEVDPDTTGILDKVLVNGKIAFLTVSFKEDNAHMLEYGYNQEYSTIYYDGHAYPLGMNITAYLCEDGTVILPDINNSLKRYAFTTGKLELKEETTIPSSLQFEDLTEDFAWLCSSKIMGFKKDGEIHYYNQGKWYSKKCNSSVKAVGHYILTDSELIDLEDDHVYPYDAFEDKTVRFQSAYLLNDRIIVIADVQNKTYQSDNLQLVMEMKDDKVNIVYQAINQETFAFKDDIIYQIAPNRYDDEMTVQTIEILK